jgi:Tfp pilus assembly protein PilO
VVVGIVHWISVDGDFFERTSFLRNQEIEFNRDLISFFGYNNREMVKERFVRQLWISGGVIVVSIALSAGILWYLSNSVSAEANAIAVDRSALANKNTNLANLAELEAAAPQAARYEDAIDQLLPDQEDLVTFTQWLAQVGEKYNVTTDAVFQGSVTPPVGTAPGTVQFSFSAAGSMDDLAAFLNAINEQSSGFLVTINSFTVTSGGSSETMTGEGTVFFK